MNPADSLRLDENLAKLLAAFDQGVEGGDDRARTVSLPRHAPLQGEAGVEPLSVGAGTKGSPGEPLPPDSPAAASESSEVESPPPAPPPATHNGPHRIGRFELRRQLGKGGCGIVFLAYDPKLRREVALKIPRPEMLLSDEARRRLVREALAAAEFDHPNLVPVYETGEIGPLCYIATAFCPGVTLGEWLDRQAFPVPVRQAARLVATIAEAVQHAHDRGVLHRDLKPNNVILQAIRGDAPPEQGPPPGSVQLRGEYFVPRVVDFGLAKLIERGAPSETTTRQVLGTPKYMAPEQALARHQDIGPTADVYALGVILYELLTGRAPYEGSTDVEVLRQAIEGEPIRPRQLRGDIPRDLEAICLKAMHKTPGRRYRTAIDLADDLHRFLDGKPTLARPLKWVGRAARWLRRNDQAVALVVLATIATVLLAIGSWSMHQTRQLKSDRDTVLRDRAERSRADQQREYAEAVRAAAAAWRSGDYPAAADFLETAERLARIAGEPTDFVHGYLSRLLATPRLFIASPAGPVTALAASDDGRLLASGHTDGTLTLWDRATGEPLDQLTRRGLAVAHLAFALGADWLVTVEDGRAVARGIDDHGRFKIGPQGERILHDAATCLAVREGSVFIGTRAGEIVRVRLDDGSRETLGTADAGPVRLLVPEAEPGHFLVVCGDRLLRFRDGAAGETLATLTNPIAGLLPPTGDRGVIVATDRGVGSLTDHQRGNHRVTRGRVHWLAALSSGGFAITESPGRLLICDHGWHELATGAVGEVRAGVVQRKGQTLFTGSDDGIIRSWELPADLETLGTTAVPPVASVAIHPDEGLWLALRDGGVLSRKTDSRLVDIAPGRRLHVLRSVAGTEDKLIGPGGEGHGLVGLELHHDLVVVTTLGPLGPAEGRRLRLPDGVRAVCGDLAADGSTLAVGDDQGWIHLWTDRDSREPLRIDSGLRQPVRAVSVGGSRSVAAPGPEGVRIWTLGGPSRTPNVIPALPDAVFRLFPDGSRLAIGGRNGTVRVYRIGNEREEWTLHGHVGRVTALAASPDGRVLVSATLTGEVTFWDLRTGSELLTRRRHAGPVTVIEFSSDGRRLITAGDQVALW